MIFIMRIKSIFDWNKVNKENINGDRIVNS
jgi:hypothetical protein